MTTASERLAAATSSLSVRLRAARTPALPTIQLTVTPVLLTSAGTVTVTATATQAERVLVYRDGLLVSTLSAPPYVYTEALTTAQNGTRSYRAVASRGSLSAQASTAITVDIPLPDTTPPSVTLSATPNPVTTAGTVNLSATASDDRGVAQVAFYVDNELISTDTAAPYSAGKALTAADNGDRTFKAIATDTSGNTAQVSRIIPVQIVTPSSAYVEPADPWTAYSWTDGELTIGTSILDQYGSLFTDTDGNDKWRLDLRDLPADMRHRRNMTTGGRALYVSAGPRWVKLVHGQAMGVGGGGTSRGILGCATDSKWEAEDFTFHGPHTHMATGQWAGGVRPEGFKHAGLIHCNLERTTGFQVANSRLGDTAMQGMVMRFVRARNTNGQLRDTTTNTGWKLGSTLHTDREVANLFQIASSTLRRIDIYAVVSYQDPDEPNYIEDTGNFYSCTIAGATTLQDVADLILCHGAFPMNRGSDYSGGGVIIDGDKTKWLRIRRVYSIETSNYGIAHAGGGHNEFVDAVAYQTGKVNGIVADTTPDTGSYDREYYGTTDQSGRLVTGFRVGWGTPKSADPDRRQDGPGNGTTSRGTVYTGVERYNAGVGAVPQSALDAMVTEYYQQVGSEVIGRRNPAA